MIVPDTNLLLYAYASDLPDHAKAAAWWQACLSGTEPIGLPHVVLFSFVRIATNPRVFQRPMTPVEACGHVGSWLQQPQVQLLAPGVEHVDRVLKLVQALGTAANLVTDAQIAAIAMEFDAIVQTADTDFIRFQGLRWFNPLTGLGSTRVRRG
jgi:toxin-antitoxin system PIN domain toxin